MRIRYWFWAPAVVGLLADLASKHVVFRWLSQAPGRRHVVLGSWLVLQLQENRGGVFGILQGRGYVFVALTFIALGFVAWMLRKAKPEQRLLQFALGLVAAGAVGNLVDRLWLGHVRDFIYVERINYPAFNLADAGICVAAAILAVSIFWEEFGERRLFRRGPSGGTARRGPRA